MRPDEAVAVNRLIRKIILESAILNDKAKKSETSKYTPCELRERIENDPDAVFVAVRGRKAVGFCINARDDGLLLLEWYGVDPAWRGHGIGHQMMAKLVGSARRRGCHKVWCDTDVGNTGSAKLLCSLGFQPLCTLRNHWYGQDFVLWEMMVPAMAIVDDREEPAVSPRALGTKAVMAARMG